MLFELTKAVKCRYISTKIGREDYLYNRPEDLEINTYFYPPFMMKTQLYNSLSPSSSSKLKNNNNNNNNNSNSRLTNMFSNEIKFACHSNDKREFRELLELLSYKIPVDNTIENIINRQTFFITKEDQLKDIMYNNYKTIIFLPQNKQNRATIDSFFPDKDNYKNLDLSMNKRFNKRLEVKTAKLILEYKKRDSLIKNKFHILFDKTLNLNTSYRNINTSSNIETYSTRLLLVCRDDIENKYVEQIVENYIKHLERLQINMNKYLSSYSIYNETEKEEYELEENELEENELEENELEESIENRSLYNSFVPDAFNFQEQVSVKDIPIHKGAIKINKKYNLIKTVSIEETPVDY